METLGLLFTILLLIGMGLVFFGVFKISRYAYAINLALTAICLGLLFKMNFYVVDWIYEMLYVGCPLLLINTVLYVFIHKESDFIDEKNKYQVQFKVKRGSFKIDNIKRGASVIGSAGSGKTESVVYNFLTHFSKYQFGGVIHDYKHFEITEMAYSLFEENKIDFRVISFDDIYDRVNPIAPRYMKNEESVNEVA